MLRLHASRGSLSEGEGIVVEYILCPLLILSSTISSHIFPIYISYYSFYFYYDILFSLSLSIPISSILQHVSYTATAAPVQLHVCYTMLVLLHTVSHVG